MFSKSFHNTFSNSKQYFLYISILYNKEKYSIYIWSAFLNFGIIDRSKIYNFCICISKTFTTLSIFLQYKTFKNLNNASSVAKSTKILIGVFFCSHIKFLFLISKHLSATSRTVMKFFCNDFSKMSYTCWYNFEYMAFWNAGADYLMKILVF